MQSDLYVHYGCGVTAPEGWLNFDASPTLRIQRLPLVGRFARQLFPDAVKYGDIVAGLPVKQGSCRAVYCSHVLEHLSLTDFRRALRNSLKILKPGGVFRIVVPDLAASIKAYSESQCDDASIQFMRATSLGIENRSRGLNGLIRDYLGNAKHLWMWDYKSLAVELSAHGFGGIRAASYGDATDQMFSKVEERSRWIDAVGIECARPLQS